MIFFNDDFDTMKRYARMLKPYVNEMDSEDREYVLSADVIERRHLKIIALDDCNKKLESMVERYVFPRRLSIFGHILKIFDRGN